MTTRQKVLTCFIAQQLCFFGGMVICLILRPEGLRVNNGISYYGVFTNTFPAYALALLGSAMFGVLIARLVIEPDLRVLRRSLIAIALLLVLITFTPYYISNLLDWVHTIAGIAMFLVQARLSLWIAGKLHWSPWAITLIIFEAIGGVFSAIYVPIVHGFLLQAQLGFQIAFTALLFYALLMLIPHKSVNDSLPDGA